MKQIVTLLSISENVHSVVCKLNQWKLFLCILVFALYWSTQEEEFYVCIYATREGDHVLFHHEGGVEVGDVDAKAQRLMVAVDDKLSDEQVTEQLLTHVSDDKKKYGHILFLFVYFYPHGTLYSSKTNLVKIV